MFVATSAGNSGDAPSTIGGPADLPWMTTVAASTQERFFRGTITLTDGDYPERPRHGNFYALCQWWQSLLRYQRSTEVEFGASITPGTDGSIDLVDAEAAGSDLCLLDSLDPAVVDRQGRALPPRRQRPRREEPRRAPGRRRRDDPLQQQRQRQPVHRQLLGADGARRPHRGQRDQGLHRVARRPAGQDPPSTGKRTEIDYDPSITIFSSRGPNPSSEDIIKPDVTAPGLQILAGNSPFPDVDQVPGELFQAIAGTSMSSPHVAGLFALLKQAHPDWSPAAAKSALMTTANPKVRDNDRVSRADPFDTGSGHVRPGKVVEAELDVQPGHRLRRRLPRLPRLPVRHRARCAPCRPVDPSDLNYPSIGVGALAGTQTVTRTITSVADRSLTWQASVEAPAGYDVVVEPSTITLAPGAAATFTVTISNNGAGAIGEWAFGALTWNARGGYSARSPIAVKGTALAAPAEVDGRGRRRHGDVRGGLRLHRPVQRRGARPRRRHAAPSAPWRRTRDQTPFSDDDDPAGGMVPVTIDVQDVAVARWTMVREDDVDIDLYLLDPAGELIASSGAGGTDEFIELQLPANGTYTMYVHGWSVGETPVEFTLDQWLVPLAAGTGNLSHHVGAHRGGHRRHG